MDLAVPFTWDRWVDVIKTLHTVVEETLQVSQVICVIRYVQDTKKLVYTLGSIWMVEVVSWGLRAIVALYDALAICRRLFARKKRLVVDYRDVEESPLESLIVCLFTADSLAIWLYSMILKPT